MNVRDAPASAPKPRLYHELADWWPLLSAPEDYAEEAAFYADRLQAACEGPTRTLLELGSGGGNNASHLKRWFRVTLIDPAEGMLAVSRGLNPGCEHHAGDMRTVRLGRQFDVVLIHDAVGYMTSREDLRQAMETAYVHCRPGGAALFAPDFVQENFRPGVSTGGHDGDRRALRYLAWTWDPDPEDETYLVDYAFMLRHSGGSVSVQHDRHVQGLFPRAVWLELLERRGFVPEAVRFDHSDLPDREFHVFVARRPNQS